MNQNQLTTMTTELNMRQIENSPSLNALMNVVMAETPYLPEADVTVDTIELTEDDRNEVLAFLAERPVHTVCLAGFIRDNGSSHRTRHGGVWPGGPGLPTNSYDSG